MIDKQVKIQLPDLSYSTVNMQVGALIMQQAKRIEELRKELRDKENIVLGQSIATEWTRKELGRLFNENNKLRGCLKKALKRLKK